MPYEENPLGIQGIDFVEFSVLDTEYAHTIFSDFGFSKTSRIHRKQITLYQQNEIALLLNHESSGHANNFYRNHGPSICSMGWLVSDADSVYKEAIKRGAVPVEKRNKDLPYPAIYGIGESLIYLVDSNHSISKGRSNLLERIDDTNIIPDKGFINIDHLTNNVNKGTMDHWVKFYKDIFGFREIRYFDIKGKKTGLTSFALRSPDGSFSIPINEGNEKASQIEEYLREYNGPGIQHLAFLTKDIIGALDSMSNSSVQTLNIHERYYRSIFETHSGFNPEQVQKITHHQILIDGDDNGRLLQVFTRNLFGPIFIEIIQRNGSLGFGEGNFQALFESIELDQERRNAI